MAFATPDELSAYTEGLISPTDPRSPVILDGATQAIQNFCGWHIAPPEDLTVYLDGGTQELFLPTLKLNSIESVTVDGTLLTDIDLEWSRRTGNVRRKSHVGFPEAYGSIIVLFNSGYESVPQVLKQIVLQASAMALSSPTGATREQAGQVAMQWATTAPGVSGGLTLHDRDFKALSQYILPKEV